MFLVAADGRPLGDVIQERVKAALAEPETPCDEAALIARILAEPDVAALLESVWDDESGKSIADTVVEDIRQEVVQDLQERGANAASTRNLVPL
jgi:hypothetical protein